MESLEERIESFVLGDRMGKLHSMSSRERERKKKKLRGKKKSARQICKRLCVGAKLKSPFDALAGGRFETRKGGRANISCFFPFFFFHSSSFRCACRNRYATVAPCLSLRGGVAETLRGGEEKNGKVMRVDIFVLSSFSVDVEGDGPSFSFSNGKIWRLLQIPV